MSLFLQLRNIATTRLVSQWGKPCVAGFGLALLLTGCAAQPRLGMTVADGEDDRAARPLEMLRGEQDQDEALRRQFWAARQIDHAPAYLDVATAALRAQNPGLAARALAWWLEENPNDRAALKTHALLLFDQGQESAAIAQLSRWIGLAPDPELAWGELLAWLAVADNRPAARRVLDALLDVTNARNAPGLHARIESQYAWRLMQPELALAWAELAAEFDLGLGSLIWLAQVQTRLHRLDEAVLSYERALEFAVDDELIRQRKAQLLARLERFDDALSALEAGQWTPSLALDRLELLNRLNRRDEIPDALAVLKSMAADGDSQAWLYLGLAYEGLGRIEPALDAYSRAQQEPWRTLGLEGRARVLVLAKEPDRAHRQFQNLRDRADLPERERLWEEEVLVLLSFGEHQRALVALDRALADLPASARLRETRAWIFYLEGRLDRSVRDLIVAHGLNRRESETDWALRWLQDLIEGSSEASVDSEQLLRLSLHRFAPQTEADALTLKLVVASTDDPRLARFVQAFKGQGLSP
ncbi:MAG: tetratricopeptide repeat protein [Wenzhouxiangella sp.]